MIKKHNIKGLLGLFLFFLPFILKEINSIKLIIDNYWMYFILFSIVNIIIALKFMWDYINATTSNNKYT